MKSGDVKRGAGIEVVLVAATPEFATAWSNLAGQFRRDYDAAVASADHWAKEDARLFERYLADIRNGNGVNTPAHSAYEAAQNQRFAAAAKRQQVLSSFQKRAVELVSERVFRTVRTNVNGSYEFSDVPPGPYRVYAEYHVFDNHPHWMVTVELQGGTKQQLDLSNSNTGWPFDP